MAQILFNLMFKVFFVVAAAYVLRRRGVLTAQDQKSATNILMKLVVYFTVIMSSQQEFSLEAARAIALTGIFGVLYFLLTIPAAAILSWDWRRPSAGCLSPRWCSAISPLWAIPSSRSCMAT